MKCLQFAMAVAVLSARFALADTPRTETESREKLVAIARDNHRFSSDLYRELAASNRENLFVSPYSISTALAMAFAGADGSTRAQMAKVLHLPNDNPQIHTLVNALKNAISSHEEQSGFQLRIANRLWAQDGFPFLPAFLQTTKSDYQAEMGLLNFKQTEEARKTINLWVEQQTNQKVQELLAPGVLNASTRLVITNAIYFKAGWSHPFNERLTSNDKFHVSESVDAEVPLMHQTHRLPYAEAENLQVLELPYGDNAELSMLVLLPKRPGDLADVEKLLTIEKFEELVSKLKSNLVDAYLPKFKMTSEFNLSDTLKAMGMSLAFSDQANFSKMSSSEPLAISAVIHKAFVDVREEGTEAAAATAVGIARSSIQIEPNKPVTFRADHPFVFLIRHRPTNSLLFLGRLMNPKG